LPDFDEMAAEDDLIIVQMVAGWLHKQVKRPTMGFSSVIQQTSIITIVTCCVCLGYFVIKPFNYPCLLGL